MDNPAIFFKALLTSVFAAISLRLGVLGDLLWLFVAAVALDYITGVIAAAYRKELSSGVGLRGIAKKVGECFVIAVALLADEVVAQAGSQMGAAVSTGGAVATLVTIWLILNELISILENILKMNIPLPPFLMGAIKLLKKHSEVSGDKLSGSDERQD